MSNTDTDNGSSGDALDSKERSGGSNAGTAGVLMSGGLASTSAVATTSASAKSDTGSDGGSGKDGAEGMTGGNGGGTAASQGSEAGPAAGAAAEAGAGGRHSSAGAGGGAGGGGLASRETSRDTSPREGRGDARSDARGDASGGGRGGESGSSGGGGASGSSSSASSDGGGSGGDGSAGASGEESGGSSDGSGDDSGSEDSSSSQGGNSEATTAANAVTETASGTSGSATESGHIEVAAASGTGAAGNAGGGPMAREHPAPVCFRPGTLIATPGGPVPVERLRPGDLVLTREGRAEPVRWLGRQTIDSNRGDPLRVLPIRIRAGALAPGVPSRDLFVSPDHAIAIDGVLIHAGALADGVAILRETDVPARLDYCHVELARHCLILAENTPAETFVDNPERLAFDNWAEREALAHDGPRAGEMDLPRAKSARQVPQAVRRRLAARATLFQEERALVA